MANEKDNNPDIKELEDRLIQPERTGFEAPSEGTPCCVCGRPVRGRRRNGYCSDRCRVRNWRDRRDTHVDRLTHRLDEAVSTLAQIVSELKATIHTGRRS